MNYLWIAISGLVLAYLSVRLALWVFPKWGLMDRPHKYGLKRAPIPYYGGIAIVVPFLISSLLWLSWDFKLVAFLGMAVAVAGVSFIDDRKGLSPFFRLLMQVIAGLVLYFSGVYVTALPNPVGGEINLLFWNWMGIGVLSLLATIIWVVLIMNTMNWVDGLNGLPSGISTIAALTIFLLSVNPQIHSIDQSTVAVMALSLAVITFVFWLHDFYPAKILMGDTGSMFLGFVLAGLAIYSGGKLGTAFLVLGFPILDAFWVILRRILSGRSPFKGDLQHFHHRLLNAGLSVRQSLIAIYVAAAFFGFLALVLGNGQKIWAIIGLIAVMAVLGFSVVVLEVEKKSKKD